MSDIKKPSAEDLLPTEEGDTGHERRVYTIDGYPEEVIAVAFAKCSRSPLPFDEIAAKADEASSAEFHEKWVLGYGHGSVAEHGVLHLALENISNVAVKVIEDNRLASYTEKSTRYQKLDRSRCVMPESIMKDPQIARPYVEAVDALFSAYEAVQPPLTEYMKAKHPQTEGQSDRLYAGIIKARVCDVARYLLPAATMTNVGVTMNARTLEWAITKGLSHPVGEVRAIAAEMKEAGRKVTPTLIKYADANDYMVETTRAMRDVAAKWAEGIEEPTAAEPVRIVDWDRDAENKIVTALLYEHLELPYAQIRERVGEMPKEDKLRIISEALKRRGPHDRPPRAFEHAYYTFDILMDYGAFRDVQRHRMATQTNQLVTTRHGYEMPQEIAEVGMTGIFKAAMEKSDAVFRLIAEKSPDDAQYAVAMAFRKRVLVTWNLRELFHFIPLRSGKKGHPSYRKIAQDCWKAVDAIHPAFSKAIPVDMSETSVSTVGTKVKSEHALE